MLADELHRCHSFRWIPGVGVSGLQISRSGRLDDEWQEREQIIFRVEHVIADRLTDHVLG